MILVSTFYDLSQFPAMDDEITARVGRTPEESGAGFGQRDMQWDCDTQEQATAIRNVLFEMGLPIRMSISSVIYRD